MFNYTLACPNNRRSDPLELLFLNENEIEKDPQRLTPSDLAFLHDPVTHIVHDL